MTNEEKMLASLWYDATDSVLVKKRNDAAVLIWELQQISPADTEHRNRVLQKLFPHLGKNVTLLQPLAVDYGTYTHIGDESFINYGAYFMDGGGIRIGRYCFMGPRCSLYTAVHPLHSGTRNKGLEQALPITIGDNVWIGGDVTILPGVTIGDGTVIGAKSLVTKDIPAHVLAVGNPCVIVKPIR